MMEDTIQTIGNMLYKFGLKDQNYILLAVLSNVHKTRLTDLEQCAEKVTDLKESLENLDTNLRTFPLPV
jgi:hypothetical protein